MGILLITNMNRRARRIQWDGFPSSYPKEDPYGKNHKSVGFIGAFLFPVLAVQRSYNPFHLLMDDRYHCFQFTEAVKRRLGGLRLSVVIWLAADLKKISISYHLFFSLKCAIFEARVFLPFPISTGTCCIWVLLGSCFLDRGNLQLNHEKDCTCQISSTTFETF